VLDRIRLQNFKTHRDTEIKLGRLTVLVGPNGAGKSSVLLAIGLLRHLLASYAPHILDPVKTLAHDDEVVGPCSVHITGTFAGGKPWAYEFAGKQAAQDDGEVRLMRRELAAILLMPNPAQLAAPVPVSVVAPDLAGDGSGLADVVAKMQLEDADACSLTSSSSMSRAARASPRA